MKRIASFLTILSLVLGASCNNDSRLEYPTVPESAIPSEPGDYAGSETCRTCHQSIYESWQKTRHTKKVRNASLDILVNDYNSSGSSDFEKGGAGITFDVGTTPPPNQTAFDKHPLGPGVEYPKLGYDGANLLIRIGPNTYVIGYVLGGTGKWKQRYMTTIDNQEYISPVQYNEITREYVWYHVEHWYTYDDANGNGSPDSGETLTGYVYNVGETPISEGKVRNGWQRRCIGCHVTGVRDISKNDDGEYGASIADMLGSVEGPYFAELPIACEACHGPSARHVDLGGGIGTTINPETMAANRSDEICGSCHTRGTSTNAEGFGYPWKEGTLIEGQYRPGDVLDNFYNHVDRDGSRFWGDGARSAKSHHQQWIEHVDTPHGKAGVTCWKCHAAHGSQLDGDLKAPVKELCLSCHDGQGNIDSADLSLHTRHKDAENQNCNYCHFVQTAKSAITGDISSHTYRVIYPMESGETAGLPNSCGECHKDRTIEQLNGLLRTRFPDVAPVAFASASVRSDGVTFDLDGGQSFDPLGGPITFNWSITSAPPGFSPDQLIAPTNERARFVPAFPGNYTFRLVVTNLSGVRSSPAMVTVEAKESVIQTPVDPRDANYMGSSTCRICHPGNHSTWEVTRHKLKTRRPWEGPGVVFVDTDNDGENDWFQGGFDIRNDADDENTTWDDFDFVNGTEPPEIDYDEARDVYTVRIGAVTYDVTWVLGGTGKWKQRFMATIGEGEYILPNQVNEETNEWVPYHPEHWYVIDGDEITGYVYEDAGNTPVTEGNTRNSWQRRCTACHATGARDMTRDSVTGEYAASIATMLGAATGPRLAEVGIGCEACHGPGSFHVASPSTRGAIINPSKLSTTAANETCGACHNRGTSVNREGFGFPWGATAIDGHFIPGEMLDDYYVPRAENSSSFWPDPFGHSKQHHQQWLDFRWTGHFQSGMTCATCHNSHEDLRGGQLRQPANQLCKSCHPSIVDDQGRENNHSKHPNDSPANVCSTCHYVYVAKSAINYDVSAHSAEIIYPVTSKALIEAGTTAIPNSCMTAGCHSSVWSKDSIDDNEQATEAINWLWGDIAPKAIARVFDGTGPLSVRKAEFTAPVTVTLDGGRSYDPNGKRITSYAWTILDQPASSSAFLKTRLVAQPTIDISAPGTYTFSLVVRDAMKTSKPQTITIVVK
ncbi:MAG: ammonia-forming cytochrome c nitrite reductase subunit c552 [Planctomycetota bacterium]|jgi:predicted CXXCH cytochrome family protein